MGNELNLRRVAAFLCYYFTVGRLVSRFTPNGTTAGSWFQQGWQGVD